VYKQNVTFNDSDKNHTVLIRLLGINEAKYFLKIKSMLKLRGFKHRIKCFA